METRRIVVPSRRRVRNMRRILAMLPEAMICVAAGERKDYLAAVPRKQLLTHPDLPCIADIRNWLSKKIHEDCLIEVDDDLRCFRPQIGRQVAVIDPATIAAILTNAQQVSLDLGCNVFCFSRSRNIAMAQPELLPVRFVQPISSTFGLRGPARSRKFDPALPGRADADFTLRTLLDDRILYADMRWVADHGRIFSGRGGAVGMISADAFQRSTEILYSRWGRFIGRKRPGFMRKGATSPMSIKVSRHSPLAKQQVQ